MNTHEQKTKEKKDHPIIVGVTVGVLSCTIMLFVTTIYNSFLAHVWPVTIHFGDYSLANVVYIMVSMLTSVVIAFLAFYFALYYIGTSFGRALEHFMSTPELRAAKKRSWLDRATDRLAFVLILTFYAISKLQEIRNPPAKSESALDMLHQARVATVRRYCDLAFRAGHLTEEAHALIKTVKGYTGDERRNVDEKREMTRNGYKKALPTSITYEQAEALKAQDDPRDALLMCLLIDHGLRCGEVAGLRVENFDLAI